ncbi:MAG TPA: hypothetical protein VND96_16810 [Candidatus Micrarchaeaceae archaeon]|nr:hypothetical protein [Candidatus Micrarchaeaceae archaeon]
MSAEAPIVEPYPLIQYIRRNGKTIAVGSAIATFVMVTSNGNGSSRRRLLRAGALAAAVGGGLAYLQELTAVIAETLLPQ